CYDKGLRIVAARINDLTEQLELDVGYYYEGGEGPAVEAYPMHPRGANWETPEVTDIMLMRLPPPLKSSESVESCFQKTTLCLSLADNHFKVKNPICILFYDGYTPLSNDYLVRKNSN